MYRLLKSGTPKQHVGLPQRQHVQDDHHDKQGNVKSDSEAYQTLPQSIGLLIPDSNGSSRRRGPEHRVPSKPGQLGIALKLSMMTSLLALVASFIFISWLWWSPHDDLRWRQWVLVPNRLQLSVTITGTTIRAAVGAIAASASAMIASTAIERSGVRLHAVAQVSIARFASGSSISLAFLALQSSISEPIIRILLMCLVLTTIGSQLTSTLLLSDLQLTSVMTSPQQFPNAYDIIENDDLPTLHSAMMSRNSWRQQPQLSETFAEYTDAALEAEGIDDTGSTIRALLPLPSQDQREKLLEFRGKARVVDSRFLCARPVVSNFRLCGGEGISTSGVNVCGDIHLDEPYIQSVLGSGSDLTSTVEFMCPVIQHGIYESIWQVCTPDATLDWPNVKWPLRNDEFDDEYNRDLVMEILWDAGRFGRSLLLLEESVFSGVKSQVNDTVRMRPTKTVKNGPWTQQQFRFDKSSGEEELDIDITWTTCLRFGSDPSSGAVKHLNIVASGGATKTEPVYGSDKSKLVYDTSAVRKQLGDTASRLPLEDRQCLSITAEDLNASLAEAYALSQDAEEDETSYTDSTWFLWPNQESRAISFFRGETSFTWENWNADLIYTDILNTAINDTGSPARALQAVYFAMARTAYYSMMPFFSSRENETATVISYEPAQAPGRHRGYWAVMGILGIFLVNLVVVWYLFSSTKFSLPDNAWHTVAQMTESADISSILSRANVMTDHQVRATSKMSLNDEDDDRFVVRNGAFVRASTTSRTVEGDAEPASDVSRVRRRLMGRGS